jgi:drug/metabolite transporter (DMT)-like permease
MLFRKSPQQVTPIRKQVNGAQMALSENMQGAALMSASMAGFALNDTALKYVGMDIGLFQSIFLRGLFAVALIGCFAYFRGSFTRLPNRADQRRIALRSAAEVGATLCFLTALFHMPLANITAILQVLPLTIALAAALFLGEPIGGKRIFAIILGFVGVMIIIRPGTEHFNVYALLGLAAVVFVTVRDLTVRRFSAQVSSLFVAFVTATVIMLSGAIGLVFTQNWSPVSAFQLGLFALAATFLFVGYYCAVAAMRVGEVAVVTPYRYSVMIWAIALGWLFFGDVPDFFSLLGMAVIFASGLFTLWRERQLRKKGVLAQ